MHVPYEVLCAPLKKSCWLSGNLWDVCAAKVSAEDLIPILTSQVLSMAGKRTHLSSEETKGSPARASVSERKTRESPLKRLKATMQQRVATRIAREEVVLSTVGGMSDRELFD